VNEILVKRIFAAIIFYFYIFYLFSSLIMFNFCFL